MAQHETFEHTRPTNDAWTGMLAISLLALVLGCLLLYLDLSQYPTKEPPQVPKASTGASLPAGLPQEGTPVPGKGMMGGGGLGAGTPPAPPEKKVDVVPAPEKKVEKAPAEKKIEKAPVDEKKVDKAPAPDKKAKK